MELSEEPEMFLLHLFNSVKSYSQSCSTFFSVFISVAGKSGASDNGKPY